MAISVFDLFKIGIGPSSSHTVGPMRAAKMFATHLRDASLLGRVRAVKIEFFGSLGATGKGHGSDKAVMLGLVGETPEGVDPDGVPALLSELCQRREITILGTRTIAFDERLHLVFHRRRSLPEHPNGMVFTAHDTEDRPICSKCYYSVGGGFVVNHGASGADALKPDDTPLRFPFHSAAELMRICAEQGLPVSGVMLENETAWRTKTDVSRGLLAIWRVMQDCVVRGCHRGGVLPGGMKVKRRAAQLFDRLRNVPMDASSDPLTVLDWVNLFALAVNEENAAGGRVVTAPTNGAAGIIPAVLHYYVRFVPNASDEGVIRFLLTAAAIGLLYKENASISGAEVGCQGEVGVACSMAAGALAEALGGTPAQVENAAEIGMEHNLGLTCDPIGGLVQVPCIERNAMASVKAINAARIALHGDGQHFVSLDKVIRTMRETGADMSLKYKETSRGGLAVNVIEC
jgi:L-serine dehydratase